MQRKLNWPTKKLGEICDFIFGYSFPANLFNKDSRGLPVIKTGDIQNNFCEYFYEGDYDKKYLVEPGDILIGLSGTIVSGRWQGKRALLNQRVVKLNNFFSSIDKNFVFYTLPIVLKNLERGLWKAAVKNVLKRHLENLEIFTPLLSIQKKIVYVLDSIQDAVKVQEEIIEKTKELKKSLMRKLFREGTRGEELKKTEVGEIPEDWEVVKLEKITDRTSQIDLRQCPNKKIKYIDVSSISNEDFKIIEFKEFLGRNAPGRAKKIVRFEDIIFATVRPYLKRLAIISPEFDNEICSTAFCVIRCKKNLVNPYFIFNYFTTDKFINRVSELQTGSNYPAVSDKDILEQLIPLPPLPEQQEIAEILQTIDQKIEIEEKKKALYEELFRAMLNKLMTGEVRINKLKL